VFFFCPTAVSINNYANMIWDCFHKLSPIIVLYRGNNIILAIS
jgi:hypothetical protein